MAKCKGVHKASDCLDNWRDRSTSMKCTTCIYYVPKKNDVGRCRRRAPTLNGWPVMIEMDWCGDHKIDEAKCGN